MTKIDEARMTAVARLISSANEVARLLEAIAKTVPAGRPLHREIVTLTLELRTNAADCRLLNV